VIPWEEVSAEEGTGIVHIAPGCGLEDFDLGRRHGLPVIAPVDPEGRYLDGLGSLSGTPVVDAAAPIAGRLKEGGLLFARASHRHRYPTCWRCGQELIFRVADEWFLSATEIRPLARAANERVTWIPGHMQRRMDDWLANMGDWCISRKRYWGLPLPFYPCECGRLTVVGSRRELRELAMDPGAVDAVPELHRPWLDDVLIRCPGCAQPVRRIPEVGDCWLDAGIVPFSTLHWLDDRVFWEKWYPADFITENLEQVRLWYYSQLFFSVVLTGRAPYEVCLSNEFVYDENGEEFHKTGDNFIDFPQAAERAGADVVRWYYSRHDIAEKVLFGYGVLSEVKRKLLVLWNTYSFFVTYANLDAFDPNEAQVPLGERPLIDR